MPVHGHPREEQKNTEIVPARVEELYSDKAPHTLTSSVK